MMARGDQAPQTSIPNSIEIVKSTVLRGSWRIESAMEAKAFLSSRGVSSTIYSSPDRTQSFSTFFPLLIRSMATQKSNSSASKTVSSRKINSTVFPLGEGPRSSPVSTGQPVKLLTRVEELKLLTKAEKAGLLSAAEKLGFSLSTIEKLGLLTKAEELGILSAATDPSTPGVLVALVSVVGGPAAFAASNLVSKLQK